jgi:hypothetical protein
MAESNYIELVRSLPRCAFISQYGGHFLLKRPKLGVAAGQLSTGIGFATATIEIDFDPYAALWQVFPVVKRPDTPFPEQISVGRANNCDVVLRVPSVSKVQMHILCGVDGSFSLRDSRASAPISVNRLRLSSGEIRVLKSGDLIQFGAFELEFVDAPRLHDVIIAAAR